MIIGPHPYLPCERCFRVPPGPTDENRTGGSPVCPCLSAKTYANMRVQHAEYLAETQEQRAVVLEWLSPPVIARVAA